MYLIKIAVDEGLIPWLLLSTNQLVPALHGWMSKACDLLGAEKLTDIRWKIDVADAKEFF